MTKEFEIKECILCGRLYQTKRSDKKFCSKKCAVRDKNGTRLKKCINCGKEFLTSINNKEYCCFACKKSSESIPKKCYNCGKEFITKIAHQRFCSKLCANITSHRNNGVCKYCGKKFKSFHIRSEVCNDCKLNNLKGKKENIKSLCKKCGKAFFKKTANQIFCSKKCQTIVSKENFENTKELSLYRIFQRDGFKCIYCGKTSFGDGVKLHIDHIYPKSKGGGNDLNNLVTICEDCNLSKSDLILPYDTILKLWEINNISNKNIDKKTYAELMEIFDKFYKRKY